MSIFNPNEFFDPRKYCSMSRTLYHRDVKEARCDKCERLNPNWEENDEPELPKQAKKGPSFPTSNDDYINITSSPPPSTEPSESKAFLAPTLPLLARRTLGANHIPGLAVGVGERGRQEAIKDAQDRKIKSGFTNDPALAERMYTFVISAAHYCYKPAGWKKSPTNWMYSERDRPVISTQLLESLLEGVRAKVTRNEYVTWLAPSESGSWSLCLFASCVVEPWTEPMTIKQMLEVRPFKVASDNKKR
jgi:hypothetical protein